MSDVRKFKSVEERQEFLRKVAEVNTEWHEKYESAEGVFNPEHSDPHNKETGATDYPFFYLDRSATPEMEDEFYEKTKNL